MTKEKEYKCIINAIIWSIILNIVLPLFATSLASAEEIKPVKGASSLSYKGQFMHMLVHHGQVPLMSSLIVGLIVGLSVYLGYKLNILKVINSS